MFEIQSIIIIPLVMIFVLELLRIFRDNKKFSIEIDELKERVRALEDK